jgi:hypothetical protein
MTDFAMYISTLCTMLINDMSTERNSLEFALQQTVLDQLIVVNSSRQRFHLL